MKDRIEISRAKTEQIVTESRWFPLGDREPFVKDGKVIPEVTQPTGMAKQGTMDDFHKKYPGPSRIYGCTGGPR